MNVVLLAGGQGTRLREETEFRPKPMVTIGGRPILWHIMKTYAHYGHIDFVVCLGYKGDVIRDYFLNYEVRHRDVTVTLGTRDVQIHGPHGEAGWRVTLAETGERTLTGGRLGRVTRFLGRERFMVTYGDGVADIDLDRLLDFHRAADQADRPPPARRLSAPGLLAVHGHAARDGPVERAVAPGQGGVGRVAMIGPRR